MQVPKRTHDLQGKRLPNKFDTTADLQDQIEADTQACQNASAPAGEAECVPAQPHLREYCPHCNGKGVVIDNMLQGTTKPCPVCKLYGYNGKPEMEDDPWGECDPIDEPNCNDANGNVSIDSMMPLPEPGGIMHSPAPPVPDGYFIKRLISPTEAVKKWVSEGGASDIKTVTKIWREAQEAIRARDKGITQEYVGDNPGRAMTATEVMEKQRHYEQKLRDHAKNYGMVPGKIGRLEAQEKLVQQAKNEFMNLGHFSEDTVERMKALDIRVSNWKDKP